MPSNRSPAPHPEASPLVGRLAAIRVLQAAGRLDQAAPQIEALCREYPHEAGVAQTAARVAGQQGRIDEAMAHLQRAWATAPRHGSLACDIGRLMAQSGALEPAIGWFDQAVGLDAASLESRFFLGITLLRAGRAAEAVPHLRKVHAALPGQPEALAALANAEFNTGNDAAALVAIELILGARPDDEDWLLKRGEALARLGRHAEAVSHFRAVLVRLPNLAGVWMALAQGLEEQGDAQAAEAAYRRALDERPAWLQPLAGLLAMRRGESSAADVELARAALASGALNDSDIALLAYPLGRMLDARSDHLGAFDAWRQANDAREREVGALDVAGLKAGVERQLAEPVPALCRPPGTQRRGLVFVVGMPRSGTTLVEQVLDAHPAVTGCGELAFFAELAVRCPSPLTLDDAAAMVEAERYLELAGRIGHENSRIWVDKAPLNAFHLGHVARLFPQARILWCRRDARDVGLSIFSENFSKAATFSTSLDAIAASVEAQYKIMRHWQRALSLPVLEVAYEVLVDDLEAGVQRMLAFCGLPWDAACLEFHRSGRVVQTPSRWQVRRPVHRGSVGRWRPYEASLRPLIDALVDLPPDADGVART